MIEELSMVEKETIPFEGQSRIDQRKRFKDFRSGRVRCKVVHTYQSEYS